MEEEKGMIDLGGGGEKEENVGNQRAKTELGYLISKLEVELPAKC